ncbi:hypothetical protein PAXRUDRAFT_396832 [Paxillus rubicundulus Ve08.2h10]|uniref:Uncharacterized protein n=1 Tax=Paxillus rubicundulus Ve08.2h10 TaxID=930991 RepID=A0A0D0E8W1_9AGAM|nr:hypothetical protein PAXRUDRAFT_396832 [Paxillus rubicundulus Ve08.2h10]
MCHVIQLSRSPLGQDLCCCSPFCSPRTHKAFPWVQELEVFGENFVTSPPDGFFGQQPIPTNHSY